VGKTGTVEDVKMICELLSEVERKKNIPHGSIKLIPSIETALGVVNAYEICASVPERVIAVAFGADDCKGFWRC
jgi:citrate lyase subunit beta/citryl-CoA lyase